MGMIQLLFVYLLIYSLDNVLTEEELFAPEENATKSQDQTHAAKDINTLIDNILHNSTSVIERIIPDNGKFVTCLRGTDQGKTVQLTNDTELIKLLQPDPKLVSEEKDAAAPCVLVLFYSKNCPFSSLAAPHFNALPRAFPDIKMVAINAMRYHLFNTQNGIVGVPTVLLFHNGRPVVRFNASEYTLDSFIKFLVKHTGIPPPKHSFVTSADFGGPVVSSPSKETDMFLIFSWLFTILCAVYYFTRSRWWLCIVETLRRNWIESEVHARHEHID